MSLHEQIELAKTQSIKNNDSVRKAALRSMLTEIARKETSGKSRAELSDAEIQDVLRSMLKQRKEAADGFRKGGRNTQAENEELEADVIRGFLPKQKSDDEVQEIVDDIVDYLELAPPFHPRMKGLVMRELMAHPESAAIDRGMAAEMIRSSVENVVRHD